MIIIITDPIKRAIELRKTLKKGDEILVVDFSDTLQGKDTSKVINIMPNITTGDYVFRAKINIKEIDPLASKVYGKSAVDISSMDDREIEDFLKRQEFDFPLWFKHSPGFSMKRAIDYNPDFVFQVAGCNFHDGSKTGGCWYCFVDDKSNDGKVCKGKSYLNIGDTIGSMLEARKKTQAHYAQNRSDLNLKVLRASGGEPTLVLDWILELWREIGRQGLDFVGQMDSNLSTGLLVEEFERQGIYEKDILPKLAEHDLRILTAIKGVDATNLESNVQASTKMDTQLYSLKKFVKSGFDIYPQMYNPHPKTLESFLTDIDSHVENLSLRIHIGPLKLYGPNSRRLEIEAGNKGLDIQSFISHKKAEWDSNYKDSCEVMDSYLQKTYGVGYRDTVRADVPLRILK